MSLISWDGKPITLESPPSPPASSTSSQNDFSSLLNDSSINPFRSLTQSKSSSSTFNSNPPNSSTSVDPIVNSNSNLNSNQISSTSSSSSSSNSSSGNNQSTNEDFIPISSSFSLVSSSSSRHSSSSNSSLVTDVISGTGNGVSIDFSEFENEIQTMEEQKRAEIQAEVDRNAAKSNPPNIQVITLYQAENSTYAFKERTVAENNKLIHPCYFVVSLCSSFVCCRVLPLRLSLPSSFSSL